jgi:broad specificity phosphatase PhoE
MTIYLVRHGETAANGQSYAGRIDTALTETGQAQAQRVAATQMIPASQTLPFLDSGT